jgi:hypothetical protein
MTKETATFSSLLWCKRNGNSDNLEPLSIDATMLTALSAQTFSLLVMHKLLHFVLAE